VVGAIEQAAAAAGIGIGVAIEIDCGYHRSGLAPEAPEAAALARAILAAPHLRFAGLLTHAGHAYSVHDAAGAAEVARDECRVMRDLAADLAAGGIAIPCVSVGSTPTMCSGQALDGVDEIRPGNYALFDRYQAAIGSCSLDDCAVSLLAAITHRSLAGGRATIDAGALALSKDPGPRHVNPDCGYGAIMDLSGAALGLCVDGLSQEHGHVHAAAEALERLPVGSRVRVLPNHACLTVAQHAWLHVLDGDDIVDRWATVRGW
jgi:D-serine deaminase-like pyridoxal phosphate-dependent protein